MQDENARSTFPLASSCPSAISQLAMKARRWNYFKDSLIERFGAIVYKIGVDAGFDCPNRDGTKGYGGCAYCSQAGSLAPHQDAKLAIKEQIEKGRFFIKKRYDAEKFILYFQAFTNTYASVDVLKERYNAAIEASDPNYLVGLSIATRPDCIDEEKVELLATYAKRLPYFSIELGLQSVYQNRLVWINRQETLDDYIRAMKLLSDAKIDVISHVMLGFPGESVAEMQETVQMAEDLGSRGVKLQMLHVIKNTRLAHRYQLQPFPLFTMQEYGEIVIHLIEHLAPHIDIHRITGETQESELVAPEWVRHKTRFFNWFENELEARKTYQGRLSVKALSTLRMQSWSEKGSTS